MALMALRGKTQDSEQAWGCKQLLASNKGRCDGNVSDASFM